MRHRFFVLTILLPLLAAAGNAPDDLFTVKKIAAKQATLEGAAKALKKGDTLYFARSPFKFTVTEAAGTKVTIALPEKHDLSLGDNLIRNLTDEIKRAISTETRLKQALDE